MTASRDIAAILLLELEEFGLPKRVVNELPKRKTILIGQLVQWTEADLLRMPNMGRRSVDEARSKLAQFSLTFGMSLDNWSIKSALQERRVQGRKILKRYAEISGNVVKYYDTIEEEIAALIATVEHGRNVEILKSLLGCDGSPPKTLESVGQRYDLTRERVRQLEARAARRLTKLWHPTPKLKAAYECLLERQPLTTEEASQEFLARGISDQISAEAVLRVREFLGLNSTIEKFYVGSVAFFGRPKFRAELRRLLLELRKATSSSGCISIERLAVSLDLELSEVDRIRSMLQSVDECVWLDDECKWLMSNQPVRNRLLNYTQKVFAAAEKLTLNELRRALSRPQRLDYVPSTEALASIVERSGVARREGETLVRAREVPISVLGINDSALLDALHELGSPVSRDSLEKSCIDDKGMNITSFYLHLSYSPIVTKLATGVFALVGTSIDPGSVERLQDHKQASRVPPEHGWTSEGKLWYLSALDRIAINVGNKMLPSYVAKMTQGSWAISVWGGLDAGVLEIDNCFASGLRSALALAGLQAGDFVEMVFALGERAVMIKIGDPDNAGMVESGYQDTVDEIGEDDLNATPHPSAAPQ